MPVPVLRRDGIAVYVKDKAGEIRYVLNKWQTFTLEKPGIYTLEGANQSGKSVLIKMLMGVLPPRVRADSPQYTTIIRRDMCSIRHVAEAHSHGLVAVFQDDELIPSMSVREQLQMRHATPSWRNLLFLLWRGAYRFSRVDVVRRYLGELVDWDRFRPHEHLAYPNPAVIENAKTLLRMYGSQYIDIVDKYPRELSGGAKAVARLVQAQLTRNVKVLFLDEAFSGVQADVWPRLVEVIKHWARRNEVSIVVVSHNQRELIQWQPLKRYVIEDQELVEKGLTGYSSLQPGLPRRVDAFPIFTPPYTTPWTAPFESPAVIFCDDTVATHQATNRIKAFLANTGIETIHQISLSMNESEKSFSLYADHIHKTLKTIQRPHGLIIIIGGGTILNGLGFVAATIYRGRIPYVLVPTTIMAIADVIVGSKTAINISLRGHPPLKNAVGVYENPAAVLLDSSYLSTLPRSEKYYGLSECLKHGLMQDRELYNDCLRVIRQYDPGVIDCFDIGVRTMELKRAVLALDPFEEGSSPDLCVKAAPQVEALPFVQAALFRSSFPSCSWAAFHS